MSLTKIDTRLEDRVDAILAMVRAEVLAACYKHAPMNSAHEGSSVIREEFEELWDHVKADTGYSDEAMDEAVQVAATGVRYVLDLSKPDYLWILTPPEGSMPPQTISDASFFAMVQSGALEGLN